MREDGRLRFLFSLAKELGMTVQDLNSRLTEDEFWQWVEYAALEREELEDRRRR